MEKAIEDIEELEKIEEEDETMIGMSFDTDTEMFMYFKEYGKKKYFYLCREVVERIVMGYLEMCLLLVGEGGDKKQIY